MDYDIPDTARGKLLEAEALLKASKVLIAKAKWLTKAAESQKKHPGLWHE